MDSEETMFLMIGIIIGLLFTFGLFVAITPNGDADIGLSQEAGDAICVQLANDSGAYAVDWRNKDSDPRHSLICQLDNKRMNDGLIRIRN